MTPDTLAIKAVNNLDIKEQVLENIFHQKALNEENQCSSLAYEITTNRKEEKRKLIDFVPEPLLYHTGKVNSFWSKVDRSRDSYRDKLT